MHIAKRNASVGGRICRRWMADSYGMACGRLRKNESGINEMKGLSFGKKQGLNNNPKLRSFV
ncbi:MAG: hypothetical protein HXN94_04365 [Prevotella salivae]|uniref:hypothetical protein n=1 Tax=Segatella salivae TaxID=228604 RepID=UPI001CB2F937|nr:hypothetical protein [Segatella salivae]MBF1523461.1 hypothetical protein [Segatella salivae]